MSLTIEELVNRYSQLTGKITVVQEEVRRFTDDILRDIRYNINDVLSFNILDGKDVLISEELPSPKTFYDLNLDDKVDFDELEERLNAIKDKLDSFKSIELPEVSGLSELADELRMSIPSDAPSFNFELPEINIPSLSDTTIPSPPSPPDFDIPPLDIKQADSYTVAFASLSSYVTSLSSLVSSLIEELQSFSLGDLPEVTLEPIDIPRLSFDYSSLENSLRDYVFKVYHVDRIKLPQDIKEAYLQSEDSRKSLVFGSLDAYELYENVQRARYKASLRGWSKVDGEAVKEELDARLKYVGTQLEKEIEAEKKDSIYRFEEIIHVYKMMITILRQLSDLYSFEIALLLDYTSAIYDLSLQVLKAKIESLEVYIDYYKTLFEGYSLKVSSIYSRIRRLLLSLRKESLLERQELLNIESEVLGIRYEVIQLMNYRYNLARSKLVLDNYKNNIAVFGLYSRLFSERVNWTSLELRRQLQQVKSMLLPAFLDRVVYTSLLSDAKHNLSILREGERRLMSNLKSVEKYIDVISSLNIGADFKESLLNLKSSVASMKLQLSQEGEIQKTANTLTEADFEKQYREFKDNLAYLHTQLEEFLAQKDLLVQKYFEKESLYGNIYAKYLRQKVEGLLSGIHTTVTIINKLLEES